jgi:hypothetical protein
VNPCIPCGVTALGGMSCVLVACSVLCQYGVTVLISSEWEDVLRSGGKRQPVARRVKAGGCTKAGVVDLRDVAVKVVCVYPSNALAGKLCCIRCKYENG